MFKNFISCLKNFNRYGVWLRSAKCICCGEVLTYGEYVVLSDKNSIYAYCYNERCAVYKDVQYVDTTRYLTIKIKSGFESPTNYYWVLSGELQIYLNHETFIWSDIADLEVFIHHIEKFKKMKNFV